MLQSNTASISPPLVVEIRHFDETQTGPSNNPWIYHVAISAPKRLEFGRLHRTCINLLHQGEAAFTPQQIESSKPEYLEVFNMLTAQVANEATIPTGNTPNPRMTMAGSSKYHPIDPTSHGLTETFDLQNGLCALSGYFRSARLLNSEPRLQLNTNTTTSAFYRWENLQLVMHSQLWGGIFEGSMLQTLNRVQARRWQELENFIRGVRVRVQYNSVDTIYTITGLAMTEGRVIYSQARQRKEIQFQPMPWNTQRAPLA